VELPPLEGITVPTGPGPTSAITEAEACALVKRDLTASNMTVSSVCHVPLTADERAALDDFVYNLGAGNFRSSTLLKLLNAGDYAGAAAQFDLWDHAGGVVLAGLLRRRQAETDLFEKDIQ
jgi:lysozyme